MNGLFRVLAAGLAAATMLPPPLLAQSAAIRDFRLYGHFTPAVVSFEDGAERYTSLADNSYSGGRVGVWLGLPDLRGQPRFNFETSLGLRRSAALSQFQVPPAIDLGATSVRKAEVIFETGPYGSFSVGQGSMATDSITQSDLSGTQLAAYVGIPDTAGGYFFRTGTGAVSPVPVSGAFPTYDGGRAPRVRWDSPDLDLSRFGIFRVAAATGIDISDGRVVLNDSLADAGLFYRNRLGGFEVKASAGTSIADADGGLAPQAAGSLSILHAASGLSFTSAGGSREDGGTYIYSKAALTQRWNALGKTALSLDFYRGIDTVLPGSHSKSWGVGLVQDLETSDLQVYVGLRRYAYSGPGAVSYRPAHSIIFGTKWVFKRLGAVHLPRGRSEVDWDESG